MKQLDGTKLSELLQRPGNIRNICIVAHVDHGKTTLADSLVASNGIISPRMAGKLRYMDSRKDEQERGITMKSSSITLHHICDSMEYLVNLIDTPGHVDFSSEVSTAIRLCDGALVIVDVVEGVCPQTQVALKQAWQENIKPALILNKIDRLILEMKLTPLDAYIHLTQVLERVNAIVGELFNKDVLEKTEKEVETLQKESDGIDWEGALEDIDDSSLYFSPDHGNVIFASAIDGWGFSLEDFIQLYSVKLGIKENVLRKTLWGDYYYNSKTKSVKKGAQIRAKKPLFVQLVLENIWALYDTICVSKDKEKIVKMAETLGVKVSTRDMRHTDPKVQLQAICTQWLPVSKSVMDMVCKILPAANQLEDEKVEKLMCSSNKNFDKYPKETKELKKAFVDCSSEEQAPLIVFVSKMFAVEHKLLPHNRPQALTQLEMAQRRELAKLRIAQKQEGIQPTEESNPSPPTEETTLTPPEHVFVAFARVYSGTLQKGCKVYVLGPKHDPVKALQHREEEGDISEDLQLKDLKAGHHVTKATIGEIYLMMGRDLETIPAAYPGNVIGLEGLDEHILKSATLSSELCCPSFSELNLMAVPILRVAIEPVKPSDLPVLVKGLKLLNQADSCVQVIMQETGEHVLVTAGEVHLEHCLHDLKTTYAKVDVVVSEPIIPFRETIVPPPLLDQANEAIQQKQSKRATNQDATEDETVTIWTANKQSLIRILCEPLPSKVTELLEKNSELLKMLDDTTSGKLCPLDLCGTESVPDDPTQSSVTTNTINEIVKFRCDLKEALKDEEGIWKDPQIIDKIWSFGPRRCGPNVLINHIKGYESRNVWKSTSDTSSPLLEHDSSFVNGFQLATLAGPLCEEPMMGVAFVVTDWEIYESSTTTGTYGPFSGQIMSTVKEGCRKSFQVQPQRLMAAMYTCNIQVNSEVLGKMYAVLGRRLGRILHGDMAQGTTTFAVQATLPVIESFNFAQEIRKQTSGLANPQLVFSHWEVIDIDPFWSPNTEEEYLLFGEKADTENKARHYMNHVRRRKGLPVDEQIVQHAEKQRTLSRKK